ncbi:Uncharacterised protein [Mycobacterium tuberculosis]|nr:Uncharacterised protein [Mycobacterium tuberculosis]
MLGENRVFLRMFFPKSLLKTPILAQSGLFKVPAGLGEVIEI